MQLYKIMQTIGRRRIYFLMTRPYNNNIKTIYDVLKAVPLKLLSDLDCLNINDSE